MKYEVREGKAYYDGRTLAEWVPDLVTRLVEGFSPERVILFGSVARGDDGPDSGIDLLVVLRRLEGRRHDAAAAILTALGNQRPPVDVLVTDVERLSEPTGGSLTVRQALSEGRAVYG